MMDYGLWNFIGNVMFWEGLLKGNTFFTDLWIWLNELHASQWFVFFQPFCSACTQRPVRTYGDVVSAQLCMMTPCVSHVEVCTVKKHGCCRSDGHTVSHLEIMNHLSDLWASSGVESHACICARWVFLKSLFHVCILEAQRSHVTTAMPFISRISFETTNKACITRARMINSILYVCFT